VEQFPHELSGGTQQRVMIAMALSCDPKVLIADEPTTALDVTIQAQILDLLRDLQASRDMGLLLITHDLGVVAEIADDIAVMYAGAIVEAGPAEQVLATPQHPYTEALLQSIPRLGMDRGHALQQRDYFVIQAVTLLAVVAFIVINPLTDIAYGVIDPRIRAGAAR
jgi:peptide/nickel transport system ATP-binding protein